MTELADKLSKEFSPGVDRGMKSLFRDVASYILSSYIAREDVEIQEWWYSKVIETLGLKDGDILGQVLSEISRLKDFEWRNKNQEQTIENQDDEILRLKDIEKKYEDLLVSMDREKQKFGCLMEAYEATCNNGYCQFAKSCRTVRVIQDPDPCEHIDGTYERKGKYVELKSLPCDMQEHCVYAKKDKPQDKREGVGFTNSSCEASPAESSQVSAPSPLPATPELPEKIFIQDEFNLNMLDAVCAIKINSLIDHLRLTNKGGM